MMKARWSDCYHFYRVGWYVNECKFHFYCRSHRHRRKEGRNFFYSIACLLLRNRYFKIIHHHFHLMSHFLDSRLFFCSLSKLSAANIYFWLDWKKQLWGSEEERKEKINKQNFSFLSLARWICIAIFAYLSVALSLSLHLAFFTLLVCIVPFLNYITRMRRKIRRLHLQFPLLCRQVPFNFPFHVILKRFNLFLHRIS